ncbi:hypothetical protein TI39_contig500g00009 [Zymoseptoria brevis]|uniref:Uncharacterized protein n=1 Tax=Zymoseptoria brevis TaxID=1047168 RepID=A0A0F4GME8_9PEZI|nr:hypothetical protein TI39_contig500g00009 [Zymoseptoria brevis]
MSPRQTSSSPLRLWVTADEAEFDPIVLRHFREEGFEVTYLPFHGGGKAYEKQLQHLADDLEHGEVYGIVAYGAAASTCLTFHISPQPNLACLVAYYPTELTHPLTRYPPHLKVLCHLAATQPFAPAFQSYTYSGTKPGFAEHDLDEYDPISASLAWTRTLGTLRKAFKVDVDLEPVREAHLRSLFTSGDAKAALTNMTITDDDVFANYVPTMTGGIGRKDLFFFYRNYFLPNPPSLAIKLVNRTIGVDRVVDEMVISFQHTQEVPWMLPGVPPTGKKVVVAMVSVVCVRGGKLLHERVYWDQASVLVQIGLLDPKLVPESLRNQGLERLPVCGAEAALKVLDQESQPTNELIADWAADGEAEQKSLPARPKQAATMGRPTESP